MLSLHLVGSWMHLGYSILIRPEEYFVTWRSTQKEGVQLTHSYWPLMPIMIRFRWTMILEISMHTLVSICIIIFLNLYLMNCTSMFIWMPTMGMTRSLVDRKLFFFGGSINYHNMVIKTPDSGTNLKIWSWVHSAEEGCWWVCYDPVPPNINGDQGIKTHTCICGKN